MCETWLIYMCDMTPTFQKGRGACNEATHGCLECVRHDSFICVTWLLPFKKAEEPVWGRSWFSCVRETWLIYMRDTTHLYVWHDSFIRVTWLTHMWDMSYSCVTWLLPFASLCEKGRGAHNEATHGCLECVRHDSFIFVTRLIYMCDMTSLYICHNSFICGTWLLTFAGLCAKGREAHNEATHGGLASVTWLIHICDTTHSYLWHDSFIRVTRLIHMWDMSHSYVWHDSFICVPWLLPFAGLCEKGRGAHNEATHSFLAHIHNFVFVN